MDWSLFFSQVCTIEYPTQARDGGGGTGVTTWTTRQSGVPCLLNAPSSGETDRFGQPNLVGRATIAMIYTGAQRGDRVTVTTGGTHHASGQYRVVAIKSQPPVDVTGVLDEIVHLEVEVME